MADNIASSTEWLQRLNGGDSTFYSIFKHTFVFILILPVVTIKSQA